MPRGDVMSMEPQRRRKLLRTAAKEFAEAGYVRASLNRVIKECGMSKSSFYHYLDGKEALFDLVVTQARTTMSDALEIPTSSELASDNVDFWERIARLVDQLLVADENELFEDFGRMVHLVDAPPTSSLAQFIAGVHTWVEGALDAGRARAVVRTDLPTSLQTQLVLAVLTAMDRWSLTQQPNPDRTDREHLAAVQLDALRRLLDPTFPGSTPGKGRQ